MQNPGSQTFDKGWLLPTSVVSMYILRPIRKKKIWSEKFERHHVHQIVEETPLKEKKKLENLHELSYTRVKDTT